MERKAWITMIIGALVLNATNRPILCSNLSATANKLLAKYQLDQVETAAIFSMINSAIGLQSNVNSLTKYTIENCRRARLVPVWRNRAEDVNVRRYLDTIQSSLYTACMNHLKQIVDDAEKNVGRETLEIVDQFVQQFRPYQEGINCAILKPVANNLIAGYNQTRTLFSIKLPEKKFDEDICKFVKAFKVFTVLSNSLEFYKQAYLEFDPGLNTLGEIYRKYELMLKYANQCSKTSLVEGSLCVQGDASKIVNWSDMPTM